MDKECLDENLHFASYRYRDMHDLDFIFWVLLRSEIPRVLYTKEIILYKKWLLLYGIDQTARPDALAL